MCKIMDVFGQNGRQNLWMFFQAVIAVYLLILSVIDIRWKKVSVRSLLILLAIAVLCQVLCSKGEFRMMVAGGLCGGVFLIQCFGKKIVMNAEIHDPNCKFLLTKNL